MAKPDDIDKLGDDIRRLQEKSAPKAESPQGAGYAMQVGLELVSGVLVGTGIGYGLDKVLHTSPFLLILCFLLGTCGGVLTVYRTMMKNTDDTDN